MGAGHQCLKAGKGLPVAKEPIERDVAASEPGAMTMSLLGENVSSHGDAGRANVGRLGGDHWPTDAEMSDRDARPAMLLPAVQARRLSTRSRFSKSVPCNIVALPPARAGGLFKA
ncbi:hypothetical protein Q3C01_36005 [Bradyrhizobium sp. UFLA05-109]